MNFFMKCPHCATGYHQALVRMAGGECEMRNVACRTCGGSGRITDEQAQRIMEGTILRNDRLMRDETQLQAAIRLKMTRREYSDMENGR